MIQTIIALSLTSFCTYSNVAKSITMNKPLGAFLQGSLSRVRQIGSGSRTTTGATFVLGNEAADADSIISSLTYAFLKQWKCDNASCKPSLDNLKTPIIPITSIKRSEMHLRRDVGLLLIEVGMKLDDLICIDECNIEKISVEKNLDLILVDHNKLSNSVATLLCADEDHHSIVKEVIDHHEDSGLYRAAFIREVAFDMENKKPEVGSTCTIVAEKFLQNENIGALNADIATLLIAVIAVDTLNMDPTKKRGTFRDQAALDSLQMHFPDIRRDYLFSLLMNAKTDPSFWESLSAKDTLLMDCKEFQFEKKKELLSEFEASTNRNNQQFASFSVPSILQSAESFLSKSDLDKELLSYFYPSKESDSKSLTDDFNNDEKPEKINAIMIVMALTFQPEVQRSLLLFSNSEERIKSLCAYLSLEENNIQLSRLESVDDVCVRVKDGRGDIYLAGYRQGNIEMSRKQIAPLISWFDL